MADNTVSGPDEKPERRSIRHPIRPGTASVAPGIVAPPWSKDSDNELQRLLAHALPDADIEQALRDRSDRERSAIASLAYSMAEGVNRQLDALGLLLSGARSIDSDILQTVGFLIRNLTQQQDFALQLGASACDAMLQSEPPLRQARSARTRKRRPRPASARHAS